MFRKKNEFYRGESVTVIDGLGSCNLTDTLECGQAFRYEQTVKEDGYVEYITVAYGKMIRVGQRKEGELLFFDEWDEEYEGVVSKYFRFDTDFEAIRLDVISRTDSDWLKNAAERTIKTAAWMITAISGYLRQCLTSSMARMPRTVTKYSSRMTNGHDVDME